MQHQHEDARHRRPSLNNVVLWAFLGIILFFLLTEHRAHLFGVLPFLLVLACPLMHMFMHGRHRGHDHGRGEKTTTGAAGERTDGRSCGGSSREKGVSPEEDRR